MPKKNRVDQYIAISQKRYKTRTGAVVEYRTRNREVASLTHTRSTATTLSKVK